MKYVVLKIDCTCMDCKGLNYQYWYMYMLAKIIFQLYRKKGNCDLWCFFVDGKDHSECCEKKGVHSFCSSSFCAGFVPDDMGSIFLMNCVTDTELILECVQENQGIHRSMLLQVQVLTPAMRSLYLTPNIKQWWEVDLHEKWFWASIDNTLSKI